MSSAAEAALGALEASVVFEDSVPRGSVWFDAVLEGPLDRTPLRQVSVGFAADRGFTFSGLEPGTYRLTAAADDWVIEFHEFRVEGADDPRRVELRARQAARLRGQVLDEFGAPAADASVELARRGAYGVRACAAVVRTDEQGRFDVAWVSAPDGPSELLVRHPQQGFALELLGEGAYAGLVLRLRRGASLSGRVVDSEGTGVGGARLELHQKTDQLVRWHLADELDRSVQLTEPDGSFRFDGLWAAQSELRVSAIGHAADTFDRLTTGSTGHVLVLDAARQLSGHVHDETGTAVVGARVALLDTEERRVTETVTDRRGRFDLEGFGEEPLHLVAHADGFAPARRSWPAIEHGSVDVRLERTGVLIGRVLREDGRAYEIVVRSATGRETRRAYTTDAFAFEDVAPGIIQVDLLPAGRPRHRVASLTMPPGETFALGALSVTAGASLRVRVVDASTGEGLSCVGFLQVVEATAAGGAGRARARSDTGGNLVFDGLDEGLYRIDAYPDRGGLCSTESVALTGALFVDLGELEVEAAAALQVVVSPWRVGEVVDVSVSSGDNLLAFETAGDSGRVQFAELPAGTQKLHIERGGQRLEFPVRLDAGQLTVHEVDLDEFRGSSWSGRLLAGGLPVSDLQVRARALDGSWSTSRESTDGAGAVRVDGLLDGPCELELLDSAGVVTTWRGSDALAAALPPVVELPDATLEVVARPGAHVRVFTGENELGSAHCDGEGRCILRRLPPGERSVELTAPPEPGRTASPTYHAVVLSESQSTLLEVQP